ncbi:MAG: lysophospholipid acyltransferase family protein, partial [Candidatus Kariarchaeaceae archaeon]
MKIATNKSNQNYKDSSVPFHLIDKEDTIFRTKKSSLGYSTPSTEQLTKKGPVNFFNYFYKPRVLSQKLIAKLARVVFRLGWKVEVVGLENVPKNTPCVFMPNHLSHLDAP